LMQLVASLGLVSWFAGGILLGLIEIITLPVDPITSTLLQLSPLLFLIGGIWYILSKFQQLAGSKSNSGRLRKVMTAGWAALFGVDAGVASINNMSTQIFHASIPYYFQGISLAQKLIALTGIFVLGTAAVVVSFREAGNETKKSSNENLRGTFWDKPISGVGFVSLLLGVVLGLAQYWYAVVFGGFILLLAGAMLYPIGRLIERDV
jgi:hypothetical protein